MSDPEVLHFAPTPYEVKELVIEWILRKNPADFGLYEFPKDSFGGMAMLDTTKLELNELGSALFPGADLSLFLENDDRGAQRFELVKDTISTELRKPEIRTKVHELLDEEIKSLGLTGLLGSDVNFNKKAHAIANARVLSKLPGVDEKALPTAQKNYDYAITLATLRAGYGGCVEYTDLFMNYTNELHFFLSTLQENTLCSTIPPEDRSKLLAELRGDDGEEVVDFSKSTSSQNSQLSSISSTNSIMSIKAMSESTVLATENSEELIQFGEEPAGVKLGGYTLDHGPWLWRFTPEKGTPQKNRGRWHKITGFESYKKMVETVQKKNLGKKPFVISVVHSMDKFAMDQYHMIRHEEDRHEREYKERMREDGWDDEDIGEPFMRWLEKDLKKQAQERDYAPSA
ncbi:hypothetical protein BDZ45DRAFT_741360 [Acephala macrosclerotiorum]|nr:hypothetical protein BDZ45DRAFT_741360 [Acephala macrosclerotiorum]